MKISSYFLRRQFHLWGDTTEKCTIFISILYSYITYFSTSDIQHRRVKPLDTTKNKLNFENLLLECTAKKIDLQSFIMHTLKSIWVIPAQTDLAVTLTIFDFVFAKKNCPINNQATYPFLHVKWINWFFRIHLNFFNFFFYVFENLCENFEKWT